MNPEVIRNRDIRPDNRIEIMSLNLRFGLADDGPNRWELRKQAYPGLLSRWKPDFFCFQEANDFQIDYLAELLPDYNRIGEYKLARRHWQHNPIFFHKRWQCLRGDHFFLSHTPDLPSRFRDSRWPRQCVMGHFVRGAAGVTCINTHFDFQSDVRVKSAQVILHRLAGFSDVPAAILAGDFNAAPASPCYDIFTGVQPGSEPCECFLDAFGEPYPGTFHGFTGMSNGEHIDWILIRGALAVERAEVIQESFDGYYPSDHFPVYAVLQLNDGRR